MSEILKKRREFTNINLLHDVRTYRLPLGGIVSILHRLSGVIMFVLMPLVIWMLDTSLRNEQSFATLRKVFATGCWIIPGWIFKLAVLGLVWALLHHLLAGVRHIWMDICHTASKQQGYFSALAVVVVSLALTLLLALKIFF
jgi:succinate dehydrogenase / fumarate reductase cytochrome b subunit